MTNAESAQNIALSKAHAENSYLCRLRAAIDDPLLFDTIVSPSVSSLFHLRTQAPLIDLFVAHFRYRVEGQAALSVNSFSQIKVLESRQGSLVHLAPLHY